MANWDSYLARLKSTGSTPYENAVNLARRNFKMKYTQNPSYKLVTVDGQSVGMQIYATEDFSAKTFNAPFDAQIDAGDYVVWNQYRWIVTGIDYTETVTRKGSLTQCNYRLKWRKNDGTLVEKYCVVEDGTKYLIGENSREYMTIGDSRMGLTVPKDDDTKSLIRGVHLLIDDAGVNHPSAFGITKANRVQHVYDGKGIFKLILAEANVTDDDDVISMVAEPIIIEGDETGWF